MAWVHEFSNIPLDKIDKRELVNEPWQENKGRSRKEYEFLIVRKSIV